MSSVKHILFPIDFSERCMRAAPLVNALAKRFGAKVTLLSAVEAIHYTGMAEPGAAIFIEPEELRTDLANRLQKSLRDELSGLTVARVAELGEAAQVIVEFAGKNAVDLIMMPTHGYGPFRRLLLGSVTSKVLHDAQCPVWTEAHLKDPEIREHLECEKILCAVDLSEASAPLIQWAARFASEVGASLRLVHAVPGTEAWPGRQFDKEIQETLFQQAREFLVERQKSAGVEAPLCVEAGDVASVVHEEAARHGADLVIIGRGVIHETLGRLRTNAHAIIRHAHCPVISV
jgi:nucleotide-binding universal stress UspA family protein